MRKILLSKIRSAMVYLETGVKFASIEACCNIGVQKNTAKIGRNVRVGFASRVNTIQKYKKQSFSPCLVIGDDVSIGWMNHISCINEIRIGNGVLFGSKVYVGDHSHGDYDWNNMTTQYLETSPSERLLGNSKLVVIGDNCWIGDNVVILSGANIGRGCIIAANSVVGAGDYPEYSLLAGAKAKIIRQIKKL